jgi:MtaA/CmuA family methyltransferase
MTPKERIYATLKGQPIDRPAVTPIFMAWSANYIGRNYRDYYLDGDVLVQSQAAVVRAFNLDQISTISDPWREASGYGMELDYPAEGVGIPREHLIKDPEDLTKIKPLDVEACDRMKQRVRSVATMAAEFGETHSVLGWVEGPMAEYADLRGVSETMMDLVDKPEAFMEAGEMIVQNAILFAAAQIQAGADMVGVGDAAASLIGPALYEQYVLPLEKKLVDGIHKAGATMKLHICGNITDIIKYMAQSGADIIDVDWMVSLEQARRDVGPDITLCGNFDPAGVLLRGTPEEVAQAARECIREADENFILMPGCEVPPATPEENIRAFCPCKGCLIQEELKLNG